MNMMGVPMRRAIRFGVVGSLTAGIYLVGTQMLHEYVQLSVSVAATVLFVPAVVVNYILHYSWTFRSSTSHENAAPKFFGAALGAIGINYLVVALGTRWLQFSQIFVLLISGLIVVVWNYLLSRFWVFVDTGRRH